jgi:hypothetical protein
VDLDLEHLDGYTADELEAALHEMDDLKQEIRSRMRVVGQALSERHAAEVVRARVEAMGDDERRHLTMALQGIASAEAVGDPPDTQVVSAGDVGSLRDVLGGGA